MNQSVLKQNVTTNKHLAAVIRQRVILLAIRAIHMLLMIADMILSTSRSGSSSSSYKSSPYDSYDKGYDDIYMDGDYDWDRYQKDKDYADGVDDAMEELDEDW
mgnify:CR=1 FL=1